jgi:hypothetical protein
MNNVRNQKGSPMSDQTPAYLTLNPNGTGGPDPAVYNPGPGIYKSAYVDGPPVRVQCGPTQMSVHRACIDALDSAFGPSLGEYQHDNYEHGDVGVGGSRTTDAGVVYYVAPGQEPHVQGYPLPGQIRVVGCIDGVDVVFNTTFNTADEIKSRLQRVIDLVAKASA